jgi:hypothetical protein
MARQIPLLEIEIEVSGNKTKFSYKEHLVAIMKTPLPGQSGFSLEDIRKCNKIIDTIEAATNPYVVLEESDWNYVKERVEVFRWGVPVPEIENFCDSIMDAESVKLNE